MPLTKTLVFAALSSVALISNTWATDYSERDLALAVRATLLHSTDISDQLTPLRNARAPIALNAWLPQSSVSMATETPASPSDDRKTLDRTPLEVPEVWLYSPKASTSPVHSDDVLIAYAPEGDEAHWTFIEAFDLQGNTLLLDPLVPPNQSVVVVETRGALRLQAMVREMNDALQAAGLQKNEALTEENTQNTLALPQASSRAVKNTALQLTKIQANDVKEPWIKGSAEIYAIASGVLNNDNDPSLQAIAMPYFDDADTSYYPNQLVLFKQDYTYSVANLQFFEDDGDDVNYRSLITGLIDAVGQVADLVNQPQISAVTEIANIILDALPDHVFADDDDYLDSCYTLDIERDYTNYRCAANNITLSARPFELR